MRKQTRLLRNLLSTMRRHTYGVEASRIAAEWRGKPGEARAMIIAMLKYEEQRRGSLHAVAVSSAMSRYLDDSLREAARA